MFSPVLPLCAALGQTLARSATLPRSATLARSAAFAPIIAIALTLGAAHAEAPRALPPGKLPDDIRLQPPKDLDGYFPFAPPASREDWEKRAERVRRQILVSEGLWPMPTKT